jgi:predicted PurR-regulated permease PerM
VEKDIHNKHSRNAVSIFIRVSFIAILLVWCFTIIKPMLMVTLWGIIIAVASYPFHQKLAGKLGGKDKLASVIVVLMGLGVIVIPMVLFADSTIESLEKVALNFKNGSINIPPVNDKVREIPLVGDKIAKIWGSLTGDIQNVLTTFAPHIKNYGTKVLGIIAGLGFTMVQFALSVIIAGAFLMNSKVAEKGANKIFKILIGEFVDDFHKIAGGTIRSVVQGVVGIAVIQATLAGIGMLVVGVPGAGVWSILVMILAIIQLPPVLILLPVAIYVYSTASPIIGIGYVVWTIFVGLLDNLLKPILMGRGVDIPMLVILLGSIGGMISYGIIGLFVGPVILALGYKFVVALIENS